MHLLTAGLPPFVHLRVGAVAPTAPGRRPDDAPPWRVGRPPPQGPRSGPGYAVPVRPRLTFRRSVYRGRSLPIVHQSRSDNVNNLLGLRPERLGGVEA